MTNGVKSKAICILGMHRSGTSTITRALNLLGAWLGEEKDLMKPLPENPEGFWERLDIYYLQERLLTIMKRHWDTTAPLPENWHKADEIRPLKNELVELVKKEFSGRPLWLWKDPRTCLLLPLWKDVLSELDIDLKVVFVLRNPLDIARSLEKRNGFTTDKGLGIWFNYTLAALKGTEDLETIFLSYDSFMDNWGTELKKCAAGLGINWPSDENVLRAQMASFVRNDLRHSVSGVAELRAVKAPEPVIRLYGFLLDILSGARGFNAAAESMTEVMYQEFLSYVRFFEYDMAALTYCRSMLEKAASAPEALTTVMEMKKELDIKTQRTLKLDEQVKEMSEQAAALQNSMSWKITKPLRSVHRLLLKFRQEK